VLQTMGVARGSCRKASRARKYRATDGSIFVCVGGPGGTTTVDGKCWNGAPTTSRGAAVETLLPRRSEGIRAVLDLTTPAGKRSESGVGYPHELWRLRWLSRRALDWCETPVCARADQGLNGGASIRRELRETQNPLRREVL